MRHAWTNRRLSETKNHRQLDLIGRIWVAADPASHRLAIKSSKGWAPEKTSSRLC